MNSNPDEPKITEFMDSDFLYLNCGNCHAEAIFNARCRTPHAETERQMQVAAYKRDHNCAQKHTTGLGS